MFQVTKEMREKWSEVLNHEDLPKVTNPYRRDTTVLMLERQERANASSQSERGALLNEVAPTNSTGSQVDNWDPIMISLVRRSMPNLIAYDVCGVQPMTGPTGLIFAIRSRYTNQTGIEALFDEADTDFASDTTPVHAGTNPAVLNDTPAGTFTTGTGYDTAVGEALGDSTANPIPEMAFSIEKQTVTAKTRALKAEYSIELAQDFQAIHGLDAEVELANILSSEMLAEINREVIRTIYFVAKPGAQNNVTTRGTFDLDTDSNGRWLVEKFKGLTFQMDRDANAIGQQTRRGRGNVVLCSADVASALYNAGVLDYTPDLQNDLMVDDTQTTFAGMYHGKKVYVDPYLANVSDTQYYCMGYRGMNPIDAGLFYCPYVPLQMVRAVGENSFQPKIGFRTRYGITNNPFASGGLNNAAEAQRLQGDLGARDANDNVYYRRVKVENLL